jgi:hypothetical protein
MNNTNTSEDDEISKFFQDSDKVTKAIQSGINRALLRHKQMGHPVYGWENGKIVCVPPEKIMVDIKNEK